MTRTAAASPASRADAAPVVRGRAMTVLAVVIALAIALPLLSTVFGVYDRIEHWGKLVHALDGAAVTFVFGMLFFGWRDRTATSGRCAFCGREIAVLSNGAVVFCHIDYDGRTTVGNVIERSLAEIVGAPEVRDMTRAFMAGEAVAAGCEHCRGVKPLHE